jgi:hypothetical protein
MVGKCAAEAEVVGASTVHGRDYSGQFLFLYPALDSKFTVWGRTPLEDVEIINVCSREKCVISGSVKR